MRRAAAGLVAGTLLLAAAPAADAATRPSWGRTLEAAKGTGVRVEAGRVGGRMVFSSRGPREAQVVLEPKRSNRALTFGVGLPRGGSIRVGDVRFELEPSPNLRLVQLTIGAQRAHFGGIGLPRQSRLHRGKGSIRVTAPAGSSITLAGLVRTSGRPEDLLLHRLAWLRSALPKGRIPGGSGQSGRTRTATDWRRGFFAGSLWNAFARTGDPLMRAWAWEATGVVQAQSPERTHDAGFVNQESSVKAFDVLCGTKAYRGTSRCAVAKARAIDAANLLVELSKTNPLRVIPTKFNTRDCVGEECYLPDVQQVIIDSAVNTHILFWVARQTGQALYRDLAIRQLTYLRDNLVRRNGSTFQSATIEAGTGRLLKQHTRQGVEDQTTWARGQAWAIHGFAFAAKELRDPALGSVAAQAASYLELQLPEFGGPPFDLTSPRPVPIDTSVAGIAAAGLWHLSAHRCALGKVECDGAGRWRALARRLERVAMRYVTRTPPVGRLMQQTYYYELDNPRRRDRGEFTFGTDYLLEAVALRTAWDRGRR
jgi:hypothetical protein